MTVGYRFLTKPASTGKHGRPFTLRELRWIAILHVHVLVGTGLKKYSAESKVANVLNHSVETLRTWEKSLLKGRADLRRKIALAQKLAHMVLRVELPEGPFLADVGFGNLAPTGALRLLTHVEQDTPHEVMRFIAMGEELTLQSKLGDRWEHIYRVVPLPRFDAEYEICNWFTSTHPQSPYLNNLIAARPGPNKTRLTLFNARFNVRHASGEVERR